VLGACNQLARERELLPGGGRGEPLRDLTAVDREDPRGCVELLERCRIIVAGIPDLLPRVAEMLRDIRVIDDEPVVRLHAEPGHGPLGRAGEHALRLAIAVAQYRECVVRAVPRADHAVEKVDFANKIVAYLPVRVLVGRLEWAIAENQAAS